MAEQREPLGWLPTQGERIPYGVIAFVVLSLAALDLALGIRFSVGFALGAQPLPVPIWLLIAVASGIAHVARRLMVGSSTPEQASKADAFFEQEQEQDGAAVEQAHPADGA